MNNKNKQLTMGSMLIALGVIIPAFFHFLNISGKVFLPMHIGVIVGGFVLSPLMALAVGMITPFINTVVTGMPVAYPIGIIMIFELGVYGITTAILSKKFNVYISIIGAMFTGRIAAAITVYLLQSGFGLKINPIIYIKGIILAGIPGIVIQFILIPVIVKILRKNMK